MTVNINTFIVVLIGSARVGSIIIAVIILGIRIIISIITLIISSSITISIILRIRKDGKPVGAKKNVAVPAGLSIISSEYYYCYQCYY